MNKPNTWQKCLLKKEATNSLSKQSQRLIFRILKSFTSTKKESLLENKRKTSRRGLQKYWNWAKKGSFLSSAKDQRRT
jgi:hypothetical protein